MTKQEELLEASAKLLTALYDHEVNNKSSAVRDDTELSSARGDVAYLLRQQGYEIRQVWEKKEFHES